jgi:hypothetical protein
MGYHHDNVSDVLEETTADFGLAQLAGRLGDQRTYRDFMTRAQYWQNVYNPETGYLQPRTREGAFVTPFDPAKHNEMQYQEGNAAQYTWMVPYNVRGLFDAMGGNAAVTPRLDKFFEKLNTSANEPHAFMANEPSFEVPWEYVWAGAPHKTQDVVRRSADLLFKPTPDGLPGNDDLGATSSWYVWAALGMYPEIPGRAELVLASPLFPRITITRPGGQRIVIEAPGASVDVKYVHGLKVNGRTSTRAWLPESFANSGGTLRYQLRAQPNPSWGAAPADAPPSFRDGEVPVRASVRPERVSVAPGGPAQSATVLAEGITDGGEITWTAHPPAGVSVQPSSGRLTVARNGSAQTTVAVRAAAGTPMGFLEVPVTATAKRGATQRPVTLRVTVAEPGSLQAAANNNGVSSVDDVTAAEFALTEKYGGGYGFSYSAQALAAKGVTPGATVSAAGFDFRWPTARPGQPDNVIARGQTLRVAAEPGATRLSFLGAAGGGNTEGPVTLTYTDGTTQQAQLGLTDWLQFGGSEPAYGNTVAVTTPQVNSTLPRYLLRRSRAYPSYVYASAPITLDPQRQLASVILPTTGPGDHTLHVFAIATAR